MSDTTATKERRQMENIPDFYESDAAWEAGEASADVPRRARLDLVTAAERAIYDAMQAVEAMAADVRLTDAVVLLSAARESVADYVDGVKSRRAMLPDWQTIESAPKDGTDALLWIQPTVASHDGICVVGYWHAGSWWHRASPVHGEPTHWMSLPASPATREE